LKRNGPQATFLNSTVRLRSDLKDGSTLGCSYNSLQYLPYNGVRYYVDDNLITHYEFPNFAISEFEEKVGQEFIFERHVRDSKGIVCQGIPVKTGPNASREVNYVCDKSSGYPYMLFSVYAKGWYTFAHYKRMVYFLGSGYRFGHVEICGGTAVSAFVDGNIIVNDKIFSIQKKELYDMPNLHIIVGEGLIMCVDGVEHRVKMNASHDLMVTSVDDISVTLATCDTIEQVRYRKPAPDVLIPKVGMIVECEGSNVKRERDDKTVAETSVAYRFIEDSLLIGRMTRYLRQAIPMRNERHQSKVKCDPQIIFDRALFDLICSKRTVREVQQANATYLSYNVCRTIHAMGGLFTGDTYRFGASVSFDHFVSIYKKTPVKYYELMSFIDHSSEFLCDFDFSATIFDSESAPVEAPVDIPVISITDDTFEGALEVIKYRIPGDTVRHSLLCNRKLRYDKGCFLCLQSAAIRVINLRLMKYASVGDDGYYSGLGVPESVCQYLREFRVARPPYVRARGIGIVTRRKKRRAKVKNISVGDEVLDGNLDVSKVKSYLMNPTESGGDEKVSTVEFSDLNDPTGNSALGSCVIGDPPFWGDLNGDDVYPSRAGYERFSRRYCPNATTDQDPSHQCSALCFT